MSKKSFLLGLSFFFIICLSITIIKVNANPPSDMSLSYDSGTDQLDVSITHLNGGSPGHYIENVTVRVNGSLVHSEAYTSQPSSTSFTYQYNSIVANIGATIHVWANCSLTGDIITRTLIVGGNNGSSINIPGYLGMWIILCAFMSILVPLIYKKIRER